MKSSITIACILGTGLFVLWFTPSFHKWNARRVNDIRQEYQVQDSTSRIQNYEWFFNQYEAIKSTAAKAKLLKEEEKTGTVMVLNDMIAEYNARSRQAATRAQWKSDGLPYQIDISEFNLED